MSRGREREQWREEVREKGKGREARTAGSKGYTGGGKENEKGGKEERTRKKNNDGSKGNG